MLIATKDFGSADVAESSVFTFPDGILGFTEYRRYVLLHSDEADDPMWYLQCIDEPELRFILLNPFAVFSWYDPDVSDDALTRLEKSDADDMRIYAITNTSCEKIEDTTVNLRSPIIMNMNKRLAIQHVLESPKFSMRQRIFGDEV